MRLKYACLLTCFAWLLPQLATGKEHDADWQKAVIKDVQLDPEYWHTRSYEARHITVETPDAIYEVVPLGGKTGIAIEKGRLDYPVNANVEYRIDKAKMFIRDTNGREGKFDIVKKTLATKPH